MKGSKAFFAAMAWIESAIFWLLFTRVLIFDSICFLPVQPITWFLATRHRIFKHFLSGPVYSKLSYFFDADFTPVLLAIYACILLGKHIKRKELFTGVLKNFKKWVILLAPLIMFHRLLLLQSHSVELHRRLDETFPLPIGHDLIKHRDDHLRNSNLKSVVSLASVFSSRDSVFEMFHEFEHNSIFSISRALTNFFASRVTIPATHSIIYKRFTPLPTSACTSNIWRYFGVPSLSDTRQEMDQGVLKLELYEPVEASQKFDKSPIVIFVHGGAWRAGDKRVFQMNYAGGMPAFLLHNGITVAAVTYRLTCSGVTGHEMVEDVSDAVDFLKEQASLGAASEHSWATKVDASRIVLIGASAGGHLSLLTGFTKNDPSIRGVVSMYGPTELRTAEIMQRGVSYYEMVSKWFFARATKSVCRNLPDVLKHALKTDENDLKNLTWMEEKRLECMDTLSAVKMAHSGSPPVLMIHGQHDPIVPISQAEWLHEELNKHGVRNALVDIPCSSHDCDIMCSSPCGQATIYSLERFLNNVLL